MEYMIQKYKRSLVEPIDKEELHIICSNTGQDKAVEQLVTILRERLYGIYLVGGIRGCGKTTTINLARKLVDKEELIMLHLNCNKLVSVDSFLFYLTRELLNAMREKDVSDDVRKGLEDLKKCIYYMKENTVQSEVTLNEEKSMQNSISTEIEVAGQKKFKNLFGFGAQKRTSETSNKNVGHSNKKSATEKLQERLNDFQLVDKLSQEFHLIATKEQGYHFAIILDELDKQKPEFLIDLLSYYKDLFFNSKLITFLIVDLMSYLKLLEGNEVESLIKSYITDAIYVPTDTYDELRSYLYREFNVENEYACMECYYETLGIFRKVNTFQYTNRRSEEKVINILLFYEFMKRLESQYDFESLDLVKVAVKELVEMWVRKKNIKVEYVKQYLCSKSYYENIFDLQKGIMECFEIIERKYSFIAKDGESTNPVYRIWEDYNKIQKMALDLKKKDIEFHLEKRGWDGINESMELKFTYKYIKVCDHEDRNRFFKQIFYTLYSNIEHVWIVKKVMEPYFEKEESYAYSVLIGVNKRIGRVIYGIEDFSFSYESSWGIYDVKEFLKEQAIKEIEIEIDDENIEENIDYIVSVARKKIEGEYTC